MLVASFSVVFNEKKYSRRGFSAWAIKQSLLIDGMPMAWLQFKDLASTERLGRSWKEWNGKNDESGVDRLLKGGGFLQRHITRPQVRYLEVAANKLEY